MFREIEVAWIGQVSTGAEDLHKEFVKGLDTPTVRRLLAKFGLAEYALWQSGEIVTIRMKATEPQAVTNFLKLRRLWPEFWLYRRGGPVEPETGKQGDLVFFWRASDTQPGTERRQGTGAMP